MAIRTDKSEIFYSTEVPSIYPSDPGSRTRTWHSNATNSRVAINTYPG